jgi:nucleoside-diphosphate kinase
MMELIGEVLIVLKQAMVHELASSPFIALEIRNKDGQGNPVSAFREFCGPPDSEACRIVRPNTLRAKFGINKV